MMSEYLEGSEHGTTVARKAAMDDPQIPLAPVSGWWTGFNVEAGVIIWRPYSQVLGQPEQRGPYYAMSPHQLRVLVSELQMALARVESAETSDLQTVESPHQEKTG